MGVDFIVGPAGFEPTYTEPKSVVLPLDDGPVLCFKAGANLIIAAIFANSQHRIV